MPTSAPTPAPTPAIDWQAIDTVLLDMDGTLLDLHFDNYFWQQFLPSVWAKSQGMDLETAVAKLHQMYASQRGTLNWYCLDYWASQLNLNIVLLKHEVKHKIAIRPNVIDLLVNLTGWTVRGFGQALRLTQTGRLQNYAFYFIVGAFVMVCAFLLRQ